MDRHHLKPNVGYALCCALCSKLQTPSTKLWAERFISKIANRIFCLANIQISCLGVRQFRYTVQNLSLRSTIEKITMISNVLVLCECSFWLLYCLRIFVWSLSTTFQVLSVRRGSVVSTVHTCRIVFSPFRILNPDTDSSSLRFLHHIVITVSLCINPRLCSMLVTL